MAGSRSKENHGPTPGATAWPDACILHSVRAGIEAPLTRAGHLLGGQPGADALTVGRCGIFGSESGNIVRTRQLGIGEDSDMLIAWGLIVVLALFVVALLSGVGLLARSRQTGERRHHVMLNTRSSRERGPV